jgi:hypothetical protein
VSRGKHRIMGEPAIPTSADSIPGPIPRDPPPPPGYVDPHDASPVLEGLSEELRVDEDGPREPRRS